MESNRLFMQWNNAGGARNAGNLFFVLPCQTDFDKIHLLRIFGAITFALILQKLRLRLSYTCAHKSGAFALSFGVTLAPIFLQLFLGQLLVFEPRCKKSVFGVPDLVRHRQVTLPYLKFKAKM